MRQKISTAFPSIRMRKFEEKPMAMCEEVWRSPMPEHASQYAMHRLCCVWKQWQQFDPVPV